MQESTKIGNLLIKVSPSPETLKDIF